MPALIEMDAIAIAAELDKMEPDLKQQLSPAGVTELIQAHLGKYTFNSIRKFQVFGFNPEGVVASGKRIGVDPDKDMIMFGQSASLVLACETCKAIQTATNQNTAEKKILGLHNVMKNADYTTLRQQFEKAHGKFVDADLPGPTIIEQLDREIEEGEFSAFRLEQLPTREEVLEANKDKNDALGVPVTLTTTGAMIRQQVRVKVPPPEHAEAFRKRIDILWAGLEFA